MPCTPSAPLIYWFSDFLLYSFCIISGFSNCFGGSICNCLISNWIKFFFFFFLVLHCNLKKVLFSSVYIEKANLLARFLLDLHPHNASIKICCGITLHVLAGTCDDEDCMLFSKSIIEIKYFSTIVILFSISVVHVVVFVMMLE